ncbi:MAG: transposase [Lachnospiraceae bacterium]|nr:transposase [Lachnospiraceae bacterium]
MLSAARAYIFLLFDDLFQWVSEQLPGIFIQNGVKILVKRKRFEDFLDQLSAI